MTEWESQKVIDGNLSEMFSAECAQAIWCRGGLCSIESPAISEKDEETVSLFEFEGMQTPRATTDPWLAEFDQCSVDATSKKTYVDPCWNARMEPYCHGQKLENIVRTMRLHKWSCTSPERKRRERYVQIQLCCSSPCYDEPMTGSLCRPNGAPLAL